MLPEFVRTIHEPQLVSIWQITDKTTSTAFRPTEAKCIFHATLYICDLWSVWSYLHRPSNSRQFIRNIVQSKQCSQRAIIMNLFSSTNGCERYLKVEKIMLYIVRYKLFHTVTAAVISDWNWLQ